MVFEQKCFPVGKPSENKTLYQNKTIFETSFLHNDFPLVKTFYILIFIMISTIFNLAFKLSIELQFWGREMQNIA